MVGGSLGQETAGQGQARGEKKVKVEAQVDGAERTDAPVVGRGPVFRALWCPQQGHTGIMDSQTWACARSLRRLSACVVTPER